MPVSCPAGAEIASEQDRGVEKLRRAVIDIVQQTAGVINANRRVEEWLAGVDESRTTRRARQAIADASRVMAGW